MGCLNTKCPIVCRLGQKKSVEEEELSKTNSVKSIAVPQEHFDRLPLTFKQMYHLKASWKGIKRKMDETGIEMFVRLFRSSGLKHMFQNFAHIKTDDELRSNEALENHATMVMSTLDDAITHIDDFDYVSNLLYRTGASHIKFANFKSSNFLPVNSSTSLASSEHEDFDFLAIKEPFLEAVRITLGDRYTDNMQNIYGIAIVFILDTLIAGMEETLAAQTPQACQSTTGSPSQTGVESKRNSAAASPSQSLSKLPTASQSEGSVAYT